MRVLFDENLPYALAGHLKDHECVSVQQMGWVGVANGKLLILAADEGYVAMLTLDSAMQYEQNPTQLPISVLILKPRSQGAKAVIELAERVLNEIESLASPTLLVIEAES